jgi:hypothetical protein
MSNKLKRIIAREGLILIGIASFGTIIYFTRTHEAIRWDPWKASPNPILVLWAKGSLGLIVGFRGYLLYRNRDSLKYLQSNKTLQRKADSHRN